jgi:hypothetical protein
MNPLLKTNRSKAVLIVLVLSLAALLLNACAPAQVLPAPVQAAPAEEESRLMNPLPELWTIREGEVPAEFLAAIKADLAERLGVAVDDIEVIRSEAVTYDDGSLGCPKPEEMYIMAQVEGYQVVLYSGEIEYDYRIADTGNFVLCELPQP